MNHRVILHPLYLEDNLINPTIYWLNTKDADTYQKYLDIWHSDYIWKNNNIYETIDWCNKNCVDKVGFTSYNFWYFENEEDMLAFKMRWI